jgi:hypothetical protein
MKFGGITATPAQNRVKDWTGYTKISWLTSAAHDLFCLPVDKEQWVEQANAAIH